MKISEEGIDLIKHFEGCRLHAYQDVAGNWTIGFGHTGHVKPGMSIGVEEAEELLRRDVAIVEGQVMSATAGIGLTQGQFDALCSFTFNLGVGKLLKSTLLRKLRAGDVPGAAAQFGHWAKAGTPPRSIPGLAKRRADETVLFLKVV